MNVATFLDIYVLVGLAGAGGFVLLYALHPMTRRTWWRSPIGRNLMAYSFVMTLLYVSGITNLWFPDWYYRDTVRVFISILVLIVVWWRFILLIREIRNWHREKAKEDEYIDD